MYRALLPHRTLDVVKTVTSRASFTLSRAWALVRKAPAAVAGFFAVAFEMIQAVVALFVFVVWSALGFVAGYLRVGWLKAAGALQRGYSRCARARAVRYLTAADVYVGDPLRKAERLYWLAGASAMIFWMFFVVSLLVEKLDIWVVTVPDTAFFLAAVVFLVLAFQYSGRGTRWRGYSDGYDRGYQAARMDAALEQRLNQFGMKLMSRQVRLDARGIGVRDTEENSHA